MSIDIKELRRKTGMSQSEFAALFDVPLSTLRKWEQGLTSPPHYVSTLIAKMLPATISTHRSIKGKDGQTYYYDAERSVVIDSRGNSIAIKETLEGVKPNNLSLYISDLFESFYEIRERFERDCRHDKKEDINWV